MKWHKLLLPVLATSMVIGCQRTAPPPPAAKPPEVLVSTPITRQITDFEDFTGRTEAMASVEIRARVTGYLQKVDFKEGLLVTKDDLLFEIDPRPYQAELARAEAAVKQAEARAHRLKTDEDRASSLRGRAAISSEEYDKIAGERAEADAMVGSAKANRDLARLNLEFTKVRAPLTGLISRGFIDPGNLVKADETTLTTVVSVDPIYAYFDVDERTLLRIRRLIAEGKVKSARDFEVPVHAALSDEEDFVHKGTINFVDNKVDPNTGTLRIRGVFPNQDGFMSPGMFVRVRLPLGEPTEALMVAEQALGTDQGQKFVYVVNDKDETIYKRVQPGRLSAGLRVIKQGLEPSDRIVVSGLQRVRPGAKITPKLVEMPIQARSSKASTPENPELASR